MIMQKGIQYIVLPNIKTKVATSSRVRMHVDFVSNIYYR